LFRRPWKCLVLYSCLPRSQRIPDELAEEIGAGDGEAFVIGPAGGKGNVFWRVEVGRDGDGAFLGRGWPEIAGACGAAAGWLLILRHRGRGVLTLKAFDDTRCLRELGAPAPSEGNQDSFFFAKILDFKSCQLGLLLQFHYMEIFFAEK
jgi:hypothetical protein